MKLFVLIGVAAGIALLGCESEGTVEDDAAVAAPGGTTEYSVETPAPAGDVPTISLAALTDERLEVGCGKCIYDLKGVVSCHTAAVVDGTPLLFLGEGEDAHEQGLCTAASHAVVSGTVQDGKLVTTSVVFE